MAIHEVMQSDELMITTRNGIVIRLPLKDVSVLGRNTQGVKLINVGEGDSVADVARIANEEEAGEGADESNGNEGVDTEKPEGE